MKYIILLCDGMADLPAMDGSTPMSHADKPLMNSLASRALCGQVRTVPAGMEPGSDVANLSILGYNPTQYYTGRAPLEAAGQGIHLTSIETAVRVNFVTLEEGAAFSKRRLLSYCAGNPSSEETAVLCAAVQEIAPTGVFFHAGVGYRGCLQIPAEFVPVCYPPSPDRVIGQTLERCTNTAFRKNKLFSLMEASAELLARHPINQERRRQGILPANALWCWGGGATSMLPSFASLHGIPGVVITGVDLLRGIGQLAGLTVLSIPGATGDVDTNFEGKAEAALTALQTHDFVFLHVEAADECSHRKNPAQKVTAIEAIDKRLLAPLLSGLETFDDYRLLILPDHITSSALGTHQSGLVPFLLAQKSRSYPGISVFDESQAAKCGYTLSSGTELLELLLNG